ncbi:hypothetical protein [Aerosakkonema sp. BLCC-F183]
MTSPRVEIYLGKEYNQSFVLWVIKFISWAIFIWGLSTGAWIDK